jgi:3-isopropylmalate/(R)-2-methylmalate dehydratase small subunit
VIVTRANFGCGSSREHAPWVFEVNAINVVIASSFARIFRQNMFNCGMLAIELPETAIDALFGMRGKDTTIEIDFGNDTLTISAGKGVKTFNYEISGFDKALVKAGGWVEFADSKY